jgi:hypothetical protein
MNSLSKDINLLEMRRSERDRLARDLADRDPNKIEHLKRNIENTLSRFKSIVPENEEQVYLFGIDIHHLLKAANLKAIQLGEFRDHLDADVALVFVCGLLGLNLRDTRSRIRDDRRRRGEVNQAKLLDRERRQKESEDSLVEDLQDLISETAASLQPPEIIPRK